MEPTMNQIEDYNGNESKEKKQIVYVVVGLLLALGLGYTMIKNSVDADMPKNMIVYDVIQNK